MWKQTDKKEKETADFKFQQANLKYKIVIELFSFICWNQVHLEFK